MYNTPSDNIAPAANGQTWIASVYIKANVATTGQIFIFGAAADGNVFNATTGQIAAGEVSIGTDWTRVSYAFTFTKGISFIQVRLDGPPTDGTGQTLWWDGLQVERVPAGTTTPTPFTSSYYGGSVYKDLVGSNNGTLVNYPTYSGSNSGSLVFDGVDDYIDTFSNFGTLSQYTIIYWAKRNIDNKMPISTTDNSFYWYGDNSWRYIHGGVVGEYYYPKTSSIPIGVWGHYCVSYNGSNISIYRQGIYEGQQSTTGTANFSSSLRIGIRANNFSFAYNGQIANVLFYNKALTASEIQQNFNATRGRFGI